MHPLTSVLCVSSNVKTRPLSYVVVCVHMLATYGVVGMAVVSWGVRRDNGG